MGYPIGYRVGVLVGGSTTLENFLIETLVKNPISKVVAWVGSIHVSGNSVKVFARTGKKHFPNQRQFVYSAFLRDLRTMVVQCWILVWSLFSRIATHQKLPPSLVLLVGLSYLGSVPFRLTRCRFFVCLTNGGERTCL